jgi:hypothetical protein
MKNLEMYVGRIVRLKQQAFQEISRRAHGAATLDNCFIVATVSREMRKLICYGANLRITVGVADVVLV